MTDGDPDPFGTSALRAAVLTGWAASPARFREDANAEEDLVRGGYRDRLVVELAQNAADAARRAGVPGRLRLDLGADTLRAANTGAPLDAAGVQGLASLRASAKRDEPGTVGRFGVGFAAVLAVSDEPTVLSRTGGVRFSADATRAEVAALPVLTEEVARRGGVVPVLRLPWPADGVPPEGFDTEVVLPLRPGTRDAVAAALAAFGADLLLALPGLTEVEIRAGGEPRRLHTDDDGARVRLVDGADTTTWQVVRRSGELAPDLLADRPVEERERRAWTLAWALPLDADGRPRPLPGRQVVHAPTPSDEPLSLPVRLLAPFPLGPDRRHVAPGPATDALVAEAAVAFADLVAALPADPVLLALVPRVGLAGAELDARLCSAVLDVLRSTDWLPVAGEEERTSPARAAVLDDATDERVAALTGVVPGLLPAAWSRRSDGPALAALGVRRVGLAEVVEAVRGVDRPASWWAALYAALDGADREEIAALPVPLADGRVAHGPAGVLLPDPGLPVDRLAPLGLRLADPEAVAAPAARRVLERLGAQPATAAAVLGDPTVRAVVDASMDAVEDRFDDADPQALAEAVLALVAAARPAVGELPWLAELALPDAEGGWAPAGELVLPGSPLAAALAEGALGTLDPGFASVSDPDALRAVGALDTFSLVRGTDPDELDVDGAAAWADAVLDRLPPDAPPPEWPPLTAVRDLELVTDWPAALRLLAGAGTDAWADVVLDGVPVPGYLRWWLSTHPVLGGERPDRLRDPAGAELEGLYEPAEAAPDLLALLRPPATVDDVLADVDGALDLLGRLGDLRRTVRPDVLRTVYARLATALDGVDVDPPERVRVTPERIARDAVVLDAPYLLPLVDLPVVPAGGAPGPVADLLDLPLAGELVRASVTSRPVRTVAWSQLPGAALAAARLGRDGLSGEVAVHDPLTADGRPVAWWPGEAVDHVDGTPAALGRALAWREGVWSQRQALAEAFALPDRAQDLAAEDAVGE
ncbi:sacsin N-terminal ATP-binding-like domain-containing protein [Blastococcus jejuensis]|uniref:sacsin N-terminal ATP-binding-like domain-containing protein n=1 Tax=Blastococcus jejuensis TaxID=351224 RepID=UPI0031DEF6C0